MPTLHAAMTIRLPARSHMLLRATATKMSASQQAVILEAIERLARQVLSEEELARLEEAAKRLQATEAEATQIFGLVSASPRHQ